MPSGPHMGRHFIMTRMTDACEGRQSLGFLHRGILGPPPPPTPAPTPCTRELFPKFSTLDLHMLLRCLLAKVSLSPLRIMVDGANQDSCQDIATVNHSQTNPKQILRELPQRTQWRCQEFAKSWCPKLDGNEQQFWVKEQRLQSPNDGVCDLEWFLVLQH